MWAAANGRLTLGKPVSKRNAEVAFIYGLAVCVALLGLVARFG